MKKFRFLILVVWLAAMIGAAPVQAAGLDAVNSSVNSTHHLTLDFICDGSVVCRIQNASLDILNGNVIWFYQRLPADSEGAFDSLISLELQDGSSSGSALFGSNGGDFSLGRNGEGSLARFMAYGTISPAVPGPMVGTSRYHADGTYIFN